MLFEQYHIYTAIACCFLQVDIEKYFSFGCSCSEAAYLTQRKAFYESHVTIDDFIEVQETFHLAGKLKLSHLTAAKKMIGSDWNTVSSGLIPLYIYDAQMRASLVFHPISVSHSFLNWCWDQLCGSACLCVSVSLFEVQTSCLLSMIETRCFFNRALSFETLTVSITSQKSHWLSSYRFTSTRHIMYNAVIR